MTDLAQQPQAWFRRDLASLAGAALSLLFFLLLCNPHAPFEQDQIAKGAKILFLSGTPSAVPNPLAGPCNFYRDEMFSVYYIIASLGYRVFGGNVFGFSNYLSAVAGAAFIYFALRIARKVYQVPWWAGLLIFLSMPLTVQSFTYGNEAAFSLLFLSVAMWALTFPGKASWAAGGAAFAAGLFSRPDLVLWLPCISAWGYERRPEGETMMARLRQLSWFWGGLFLSAGLYWLVILRKLPEEVRFDYPFSAKLLIAYLTYPFCLPVLGLALLGAGLWIKNTGARGLLVVAMLLPPLLYYFRMLTSPKFISPILPMVGLFACYGWRVAPLWARGLVGGGVLFFLLFSLTPYGVLPPSRGPVWYVPTSDGPSPTGSYISFYKRSREGFFQERYLEEIKTVTAALAYHRQHREIPIAGYFDYPQIMVWDWVHHQAESPTPFWPKVLVTDIPEATNVIMARISYLRPNTFTHESRERLNRLLREGRVRALDTTSAPFPELILIGAELAAGSDEELGRRILYAHQRSRGSGFVKRSGFYDDLAATSWVPSLNAAKLEGTGLKKVYEDRSFTAFGENVTGASIYSTLMPLIYYRESDPRPQVQSRD